MVSCVTPGSLAPGIHLMLMMFCVGPIVRVNPHELSIKDSEFYDQLYVAGSKRRTDNWSHFGKGIDFDGKSECRRVPTLSENLPQTPQGHTS
jgi:hypothetical protein